MRTRWPRKPRRPATRSSGSRSPTRSTSRAEFIRWEVATAIAGAVLAIDPFDQPNVEEAKQRTRDLLAGHGGSATPPAPIVSDGGLTLYGDAPLRLSANGDRTLVGELRRQLDRRRPNAYLAIQAFIAPTEARDEAIASIRTTLRDATALRDDRGLRAALPPLDRPAPQGWRADRLVPAAHLGPSDRPADPRLAVHVRTADRRPGPGRLRVDRVPRPADRAGPPRRPGDRPAAARGRPRRGAPRHLTCRLVRDGHVPRRRRTDQHEEALTGGLGNADRVRRARPDGGEHGPPPAPRRPRGDRLQPDAREDARRSPARARSRRSRSRSSSRS